LWPGWCGCWGVGSARCASRAIRREPRGDRPAGAEAVPRAGDRADRLASAGAGAALAILFGASLGLAQAAGAAREPSYVAVMRWAPLIFQGFLFNLLISVLSMALGTVVGALLGSGRCRRAPGCAASRGRRRSFSAMRRGWCCFTRCS
jgi:hypothetical protein